MLRIDLPSDIKPGNMLDWRQLGDITAEAMQDDPVNQWIFGTTAAMKATFRILARDIYTRNGFCHLINDSAAAMWCISGTHRHLGLAPTVDLAWQLLRKGKRSTVARVISAGEKIEAEHPEERHLYLFAIGTRKDSRGKGLGKRLMAPMLETADREGLPCYLENTNPAHAGFFKALGFEEVKQFCIGRSSPPIQAMWRTPRSYPLPSE